jgi:hypothetical protein
MRIGNYTTQIASDVIHDGLSVELIDQDGEIVAEVLRCDASETLSLEKFKANIPLEVEEQLVVYARERLGEFESGKPFGEILVLSRNNKRCRATKPSDGC